MASCSSLTVGLVQAVPGPLLGFEPFNQKNCEKCWRFDQACFPYSTPFQKPSSAPDLATHHVLPETNRSTIPGFSYVAQSGGTHITARVRRLSSFSRTGGQTSPARQELGSRSLPTPVRRSPWNGTRSQAKTPTPFSQSQCL